MPDIPGSKATSDGAATETTESTTVRLQPIASMATGDFDSVASIKKEITTKASSTETSAGVQAEDKRENNFTVGKDSTAPAAFEVPTTVSEAVANEFPSHLVQEDVVSDISAERDHSDAGPTAATMDAPSQKEIGTITVAGNAPTDSSFSQLKLELERVYGFMERLGNAFMQQQTYHQQVMYPNAFYSPASFQVAQTGPPSHNIPTPMPHHLPASTGATIETFNPVPASTPQQTVVPPELAQPSAPPSLQASFDDRSTYDAPSKNTEEYSSASSEEIDVSLSRIESRLERRITAYATTEYTRSDAKTVFEVPVDQLEMVADEIRRKIACQPRIVLKPHKILSKKWNLLFDSDKYSIFEDGQLKKSVLACERSEDNFWLTPGTMFHNATRIFLVVGIHVGHTHMAELSSVVRVVLSFNFSVFTCSS